MRELIGTVAGTGAPALRVDAGYYKPARKAASASLVAVGASCCTQCPIPGRMVDPLKLGNERLLWRRRRLRGQRSAPDLMRLR
jgi:hypothetical protein